MTDYIDRQAAIDVLEERIQANGYSNAALVSEFNRSIGYLMRLPSAEAVPVKHGRWEWIGGYGYQYRCSECIMCAERRTKYCPNCGAKMDAEEGEPHEQN